MSTYASFCTLLRGRRIADAPPPPLLKLRSSTTFITFSIAIAVFTDIFLYAVVVPVLPFALTIRAGVQEQDVQKWTSIFLAVYGAALAAGSPFFGWFADRTTSRRFPLLLGLFALGGATVMLCVGSNLAVLIIGRFLQGLSASVVWTVGLALLSDTVKKEEMGQAMGYIAAAMSAGSLCGPLLGGVVYERAGYYAVFAMGFALIGIDIFLRFSLIEKSVALQWTAEVPPQASNVDDITAAPAPAPAPAPSAGLTLTEKSTTREPAKGWISYLPPFITLLATARVLVALFGCFSLAVFLAAFDSSLPLFVAATFHWSSLGAGLIFICLVIPALFSPLIGTVSDRYGSRTICTSGLFGAVPFWVCLRFVTHDTLNQKILLCGLLVGLGTCIAMVMAPLMADIDHAVSLEEKKDPHKMGKRGAAAQGFGLFNLAYAIGTLVGPLWAGFVVESNGWGTMVWTMALLSGVSAIATFTWTGGRIMLKGKESEGAQTRSEDVVV